MKRAELEFGIAIRKAIHRYKRAVIVSSAVGRLESLDSLVAELGVLHLEGSPETGSDGGGPKCIPRKGSVGQHIHE